jgi:hypothetical protein
MKLLIRLFLLALFALPIVTVPLSRAQDQAQPEKAEKKSTTSPEADAQENNIKEYILLMRIDVPHQKTEIMGAMMLLSTQDSAKFWPIYSEYDAELTKLNDNRVANTKEYARYYDQMTDEKADELIQQLLAYQKQRSDLMAKTYDLVKQALGATTAARFVQIEHQLLLIIDLQIDSSLPVTGQGS